MGAIKKWVRARSALGALGYPPRVLSRKGDDGQADQARPLCRYLTHRPDQGGCTVGKQQDTGHSRGRGG